MIQLIPFDLGFNTSEESKPARKRKTLTHSERIFIWEHPRIYGRKCHICGGKITKISDLELDHKRAYSKGGTKLFLAHKQCNRMKGSRGLSYVQKRVGLKRVKKVKRKRRTSGGYYMINPLTGRKEKVEPLFRL